VQHEGVMSERVDVPGLYSNSPHAHHARFWARVSVGG
jgi:hypothetical protein